MLPPSSSGRSAMTLVPSILSLPVFLGLVTAAAVTDVRSFRIPDGVPLALAVTLLALHAVTGDWSALPDAVAAGSLALAVGWGLQALGVWGGGDAKLVAAIALWTGMAQMPRFLLATALAGGVLALWVLARGRLGIGTDRKDLPYGLAIAVGGADWAWSRIGAGL